MVKFLSFFICGIALAASAQAATYYRDRVVTVPITGRICMIEISDGKSINGNLVQDVEIGMFTRIDTKQSFPVPKTTQVTYEALRINLVNGQYYEFTKGNLEHIRYGFMAKLAKCEK